MSKGKMPVKKHGEPDEDDLPKGRKAKVGPHAIKRHMSDGKFTDGKKGVNMGEAGRKWGK